MKPSENIPRFKTEDEEREFWAEHDSTDFIDWSAARKISLPQLKPGKRPQQEEE